ncbi:MAG: SLC13 family permease [Oscillospiraceae bacterium]
MEKVITKTVLIIKNDTILCIASILAVLSSFFVKPSLSYINYIDFRVLAILFCFMLVVAGLQQIGVFKNIGIYLEKKVKTIKGFCLVLTLLCFFLSMLITNDATLITLVPLTIATLNTEQYKRHLMPIIIIETIAANLGSMLTPMGNPQNLYLFSLSNVTATRFMLDMLPLTIISLLLIIFLIVIQKNEVLIITELNSQTENINKKSLVVYCLLFIILLLNVLNILPYKLVFFIVTIAVLFWNKKLFRCVDYSLLLTFVAFFIFIGNIGSINIIKTFLEQIILGNEFLGGILTSQFMSNVPAAMLLSRFTTNYTSLLWGVNAGGLGTLIASMASLISYKFYANAFPNQRSKYILLFSIYNFIPLVIMLIFGIITL